MAQVAEKLSFLEEMMQRVAYTQMQANVSIDKLSREMREFKDEMKEFKDEMRDFKDEMKEFKDEMRDFKDEMRDFKTEMSDYKDWSKEQITIMKEEIVAINQQTATMNKQIIEISQQNATMNKQIGTMNRQWGDLANKLGTVVEDIVAPNIPRIAEKYFGCKELDYIAIRVKKRSVADKSRRKEFDAIAACDNMFIVNETKSSPEIRDVDKFAKFVKSKELFDYFPEYKDYKTCPVFSSLYLDDAFVSYLSRKGIYALTMKSDTMELVNFESLKMQEAKDAQ
ncbi:hypothetical protein MTBBW1_230005 [Desulfamplus magnetovallimortis]|uniref:Uncharacterized protein n=1 Tax=Desulfamplus magnetovallimortis TaxID=1246637 RepID=A0A1W1HDE9_9BACT|nr:hypothetical protein [Desulfamplus magnetovallimortis]SLM30521.1 hypothetical protein MTBBW1_230005 [Desulfamplus magnetovallimortis]